MNKDKPAQDEVKHNHPVSTTVAVVLLVLYFGFVVFLLANMEEPPTSVAMFVLVVGAVAVYFVPLGVRRLCYRITHGGKVKIK